LPAFQSINAVFVGGGDFREIANKIGVPLEDSVVLLHRFSQVLSQFFRRLGQALHVRREQLQTLSQSLVSFGEPIEPLVSGNADILPLFSPSQSDGKSNSFPCNSL
jgi:hypothetical protein